MTGDATRVGWMVGVGVEYAFAQNWSVKAESNYMDLRTERIRRQEHRHRTDTA